MSSGSVAAQSSSPANGSHALGAGVARTDNDSHSHRSNSNNTNHPLREEPMSLSRSPSPQRGGGWATAGLSTPRSQKSSIRGASPRKTYTGLNGGPTSAATSSTAGQHGVTWASAQARSAEVNGYPNGTAGNGSRMGYIRSHFRKISSGLPLFKTASDADGDDRLFADKEKLGRGRLQAYSQMSASEIASRIGRLIWKMRLRFMLLLTLILAVALFFSHREWLLFPKSHERH